MKRLLLLLSIGFLNLNAMQKSADPFTERVNAVLERPQSPEAIDHLVIHIEIEKPVEMSSDEWLDFLWKNGSQFQTLPCIPGKNTHVQFSIQRRDSNTHLWARLPEKLVGIIIAHRARVKDQQLISDLEDGQKKFDFVAEPTSPVYQEANAWYCRAIQALL